MTTFHFVRHGKIRRDVDGAIPPGDPGLSTAGREQALRTAQELARDEICCVYSSPLKRATETADVIAAHCGGDAGKLHVEVTPALRERINWGDLPGQSHEDFQALWEKCNANRKFVPPFGDSSIDAGARLESFCLNVLREPPQDAVIAVTHGGIIADFLLNLCSEKELQRVNREFAEAPFATESLPEGSITTLRFDGYSLKVLAIGEIALQHAH